MGLVSPHSKGEGILGRRTVMPFSIPPGILWVYSMSLSISLILSPQATSPSRALAASCDTPSGPVLLLRSQPWDVTQSSCMVKARHGVVLHWSRIALLRASTRGPPMGVALAKIPVMCLERLCRQFGSSVRGRCHPRCERTCCKALRARQFRFAACSASCFCHARCSCLRCLLTAFQACRAAPPGVAWWACWRIWTNCLLSRNFCCPPPGSVIALARVVMVAWGSSPWGGGTWSSACTCGSGRSRLGPQLDRLAPPPLWMLSGSATPSWSEDAMSLHLSTCPAPAVIPLTAR